MANLKVVVSSIFLIIIGLGLIGLSIFSSPASISPDILYIYGIFLITGIVLTIVGALIPIKTSWISKLKQNKKYWIIIGIIIFLVVFLYPKKAGREGGPVHCKCLGFKSHGIWEFPGRGRVYCSGFKIGKEINCGYFCNKRLTKLEGSGRGYTTMKRSAQRLNRTLKGIRKDCGCAGGRLTIEEAKEELWEKVKDKKGVTGVSIEKGYLVIHKKEGTGRIMNRTMLWFKGYRVAEKEGK